MRRLHSFTAILALALGVSLAAGPLAMPVAAQSNEIAAQSSDVIPQSNEEREYSNARIVRLSLVDGEAQVFRPESGEWEEARQNLPIQKAYAVATGRGRVEIELESGATARLDEFTELEFTELALVNGGRVTELRLERGSAMFYANLAKRDEFLVRANGHTINLKKNSRVRLSAENANILVAVLKGEVRVESEADASYDVEKNQELRLTDEGAVYARRADDTEFEQWAQDREEVLTASYDDSRRYVDAPFRYGVGDLSRHGYWNYASGYGYVWQPHAIGFTPYVNGNWIWISGYGWSWVGYEPWGWLPYHYGRWVWIGHGWAWLPGHFQRWSPAHVWWVRFGDGSLGWCPRSPHDRPGRRPRHINTATGVIGGRPAVRNPRGGAAPVVLAGPPTRDNLDLHPGFGGRNPRTDRAGRGPQIDRTDPAASGAVPRSGFAGATRPGAAQTGDATPRTGRNPRGDRAGEATGRVPVPRGEVRFDRDENKYVNDATGEPQADAPAPRGGFSGSVGRPRPSFDRGGDAPRANGSEASGGNAAAGAGTNSDATSRGSAGNGSAPRNDSTATPRSPGFGGRGSQAGSRPDAPSAQRPSQPSQPRANTPPPQQRPSSPPPAQQQRPSYQPPPPQQRPSAPPPQARPSAPPPRPSAPASSARPQSSGQRPSSSMRSPQHAAPTARPAQPTSRPPARAPRAQSPRGPSRPSNNSPR